MREKKINQAFKIFYLATLLIGATNASGAIHSEFCKGLENLNPPHPIKSSQEKPTIYGNEFYRIGNRIKFGNPGPQEIKDALNQGTTLLKGVGKDKFFDQKKFTIFVGSISSRVKSWTASDKGFLRTSLQEFKKVLEPQLEKLDAINLAKVILFFARATSSLDPQFLRQWSTAAVAHIEEFNSQDLSTSIYAFAMLGIENADITKNINQAFLNLPILLENSGYIQNLTVLAFSSVLVSPKESLALVGIIENLLSSGAKLNLFDRTQLAFVVSYWSLVLGVSFNGTPPFVGPFEHGTTTTPIQMEIVTALEKKYPTVVWKTEAYIPEIVSHLDIDGDHRIFIEIDGAHHYFFDSSGREALRLNDRRRKEILERLVDKKVIRIKNEDWRRYGEASLSEVRKALESH